MANKRITELTTASSVDGTELLEIVQAGENKKVTASLIGALAPDASETVAGIVEEATDAQTLAGTAMGETGAKLTVTPAKLKTYMTATTEAGTTIVFDKIRTYGKTSPLTGNLTVDETDGIDGTVQLVKHNDSSEPTITGSGITVNKLSGSYINSVDNYIYVELVSSTEVVYSVSQVI
jgi:hypothetical protein